MDKKFLKKIWDSVWEKGLTELEIQKRYYIRLDKELIGEERTYLKTVQRKIDLLEIESPFKNLLQDRTNTYNNDNISLGLKNTRIEGDGTEWIIVKDKNGNLFKRALGSDEKIYLPNTNKR